MLPLVDYFILLSQTDRAFALNGTGSKYGDKLTAERVAELPLISQRLFIYGQRQTVHYRSCLVRARFLDGQQVRAVWSQIENNDGSLRQPRLILSTDLGLSATRILLAYNRRWSIEDLFNQLKNRWGWKDAWQQSRQVLHRWTQILSTSYALPQLLAQKNSDEVKDLASTSPWRNNQPITAGRVRQGLQRIFRHVDIRSHWHPKSGKFMPQSRGKKPDRPPDLRNTP
ncbi:transposase [Pelovirga terrestris]|uniref:Transposase n=1 Tax=Pelovirga terrestris TaxID=2771352 RepID=A0A8J6QVW5_9BACT|nr:transposase [Pelovirga terrestris]MBD1399108.1 transposase [Pelovirga terrestris]